MGRSAVEGEREGIRRLLESVQALPGDLGVTETFSRRLWDSLTADQQDALSASYYGALSKFIGQTAKIDEKAVLLLQTSRRIELNELLEVVAGLKNEVFKALQGLGDSLTQINKYMEKQIESALATGLRKGPNAVMYR